MENELTQANANLPSEPLPTKRVVNWGGVLKGVAIIGAVALVAVVALPAFTAIGGSITAFIAQTPALEGIAAGIGEAAVWIGNALSYGVNYVGGFLGELGSMALEGLGLADKTWTGAQATTKAIGLAGAAATTAVAAHAAMPAIQHLQLGMDVPVTPPSSAPSVVDPNLLTQQATQTNNASHAAHAAHHSMLHDAAHAAHHAAEEADVDAEAREEQQGKKTWANKFAHKATFTNYADAARSKQTARIIPPPADSFGGQIAADRTNLESALAK